MDGRNKRAANARTWAEKEQRKALWMKAVWRSHAGCSEAVCGDRLRPTASRRQHLSTQDARSAGFLTESRQAYSYRLATG
jgi:hypothetical protein